ncbi:sugar ABC transporter substrate-binding protein [Nocardioides alcanivorans]|uniref:sugar ABC transporter substrate-binding protein n=1 Tax=Nocardioides alcanivorans TaxID=2897352 RepID=UPI001F358A41|nr:sugar ABC transporter substrate-binding protein [Nocardioides alcanivorans]
MRARKLMATLAALAATAMMAACSTGSTGNGSSASDSNTLAAPTKAPDGPLKGKKILYVDAVPGNPLIDGIAQGLHASLSAQGADFARVFQVNANNQFDLAAGNQRITEGIAQKVDAIILFPSAGAGAKPGIDAARNAGIPIFTIEANRDLPDVDGALRWPDAARGKEAAEALAEAAGGSGEAAVISGVATQNIDDAVQAAEEGLEAAGMTLVGDSEEQRNLQDDAPGAQEIATALLQQYPELKALMVFNANSATGAIAAARQLGRTDVVIGTLGGEDANIDQLKSGQLAVAYDFNGYAYGTTFGPLAADVVQGKTLENKIIDAPLGKLYTEENADEYVPAAERFRYVKIPSGF